MRPSNPIYDAASPPHRTLWADWKRMPPVRSGDVLAFRGMTIEQTVRIAGMLVLILASLLAAYYLVSSAAAAAHNREAAATCETFGVPAAIPGAPARVEWNGAIAFELDGKSRNPAWAMTVLTPKTVRGSAVRLDRFRADSRVPAEWRATLRDYEGSGYQRGHLLASAHFGQQADRDATFTLSNIAPQHPALNQGNAWKAIEANVRASAQAGETVAVVVLPLYPRAVDGKVTIRTIGPNHVWVPDRYACAVLLAEGAKPQAMHAWILPNGPEAEGADGRASVDDVEREAGFDLFWALDDATEERLEAARGLD